MIDQVVCTAKTHTIKINLFERAGYLHKGNKKENQLVEKNTLWSLIDGGVGDGRLENFANIIRRGGFSKTLN